MTDTPKLGLTYLAASQAQKHVTVNDALRQLDGLVQASAADKDLTAPPGSPSPGDAYIVAAGATGVWAGQDGKLAVYHDTAWYFYTPAAGWLVYVADEAKFYLFDGTAWGLFGSTATTGGGNTVNKTVEETLTLSGATVSSSVVFPNRSFVYGASVYVTSAITGATSFDCGYSGGVSYFGGSLGVTLGSSNVGVTGGFGVYADEPIVLTANGGNFTGGEVKVTLHYVELTPAS